ncbi:MAG: hypothetical protein WAU82_11525 [Candidatus Binatus sp.]|uniref:hypothetical protein n=1 Tax=Candidatus Binatus sp. TaxID=2811406 RepID=UPI003BAF268B
MEPRFAADYRHFTMVMPHETLVIHPNAMPYGSHDEDTMALVLALTGLALMAVATVSMLIAFAVL